MLQDRGAEERRREFEEVALAHMDTIYTAALRFTGNKSEAEDLFQETFLRAYRFFHRQFQRGTDCRAWLYTILRTVFLTRLRKEGRYRDEFDEERLYRQGVHDSLLGRLGNPEQECARRLTAEDIQRALLKLPVRLRLVVVMADLQGCSYKEIASACDCPIGTVMSRLHRGRRLLRTLLHNHGPEAMGVKEHD